MSTRIDHLALQVSSPAKMAQTFQAMGFNAIPTRGNYLIGFKTGGYLLITALDPLGNGKERVVLHFASDELPRYNPNDNVQTRTKLYLPIIDDYPIPNFDKADLQHPNFFQGMGNISLAVSDPTVSREEYETLLEREGVVEDGAVCFNIEYDDTLIVLVGTSLEEAREYLRFYDEGVFRITFDKGGPLTMEIMNNLRKLGLLYLTYQ